MKTETAEEREALPPLPKPFAITEDPSGYAYTAAQMRAYAIAARASREALPVAEPESNSWSALACIECGGPVQWRCQACEISQGLWEPVALSNAPPWLPTAKNINGLPEPIRRYIHDLATRCDPAGDVASITLLRDQVRALSESNRMLRAPSNAPDAAPLNASNANSNEGNLTPTLRQEGPR